RAVNECTASRLNAFLFERCEELVEEEFVEMSIIRLVGKVILGFQDNNFEHEDGIGGETFKGNR
ncbi:MAG: hypothetical protein LBU65_00165, partial [Planctomycetaceae bacterium]|nr:hypothetical protein [Planctomycetaceae bacterium]